MAIIPTSGEFSKVPDGGSAERFVVTCTPTAEDYSGTMDKTVSEILTAWNDGKEIYFHIQNYGTFPLAAATDDEAFMAYGVMLGVHSKFIVLVTDYSGTSYSTTIYQLTPLAFKEEHHEH